jgi:hypothetical protein
LLSEENAMNNSNILGWVVLLMIVGGSAGWLLQEVPKIIKAKYFNKNTRNTIRKYEQEIKTGMYYHPKK